MNAKRKYLNFSVVNYKGTRCWRSKVGKDCPSFPSPHQCDPATRKLQPSVLIAALLCRCHLDVQGLLQHWLLQQQFPMSPGPIQHLQRSEQRTGAAGLLDHIDEEIGRAGAIFTWRGKFLFTSGVARHGPSRARPDLLVTHHAYLIPFHEVLYTDNRLILIINYTDNRYNQLIEELEPCSLRWLQLDWQSCTQKSSWLDTRPRKSANLTKQGLLAVQSTTGANPGNWKMKV